MATNGMPWIPILIWLRIRIKLLKMRRDAKRSPDLGVMFIAAFSMMIPMMAISFYMEMYCGTLTHLSRTGDIDKTPPSKYYDLRSYYIDRRHRGLCYSSYTSGKLSSKLNFEIHIVCPLYNSKADVYGEDTSLGIIALPTPANKYRRR